MKGRKAIHLEIESKFLLNKWDTEWTAVQALLSFPTTLNTSSLQISLVIALVQK